MQGDKRQIAKLSLGNAAFHSVCLAVCDHATTSLSAAESSPVAYSPPSTKIHTNTHPRQQRIFLPKNCYVEYCCCCCCCCSGVLLLWAGFGYQRARPPGAPGAAVWRCLTAFNRYPVLGDSRGGFPLPSSRFLWVFLLRCLCVCVLCGLRVCV